MEAYLDKVARRPFEWGQHDCAFMAADAVAAQTGVLHGKDFRGTYSDLRGGIKAMKAAGYDDHADFAAKNLAEIHVSEAIIGDIALIDDAEFSKTLGIVAGSVILAPSPTGTAYRPLTSAKRAFKVG